MPITASAKKALRGSARKKAVNDRRKKTMKDSIKEIEKLIKAKSLAEAQKLVSATQAAIDKAAKKNVIHKNKASRLKKRAAAQAKAGGVKPSKSVAKKVAPKKTVKKAAPKKASKK